MTDTGQPDPPTVLLDAARAVVRDWLVRCVVETATSRTGSCDEDLRRRAEETADRAAPDVLERLAALLRTDVDEQRTGPLAVLRSAVVYPTEVLAAAGIPEVARDDFEVRAFPADRYRLSPASFMDIDPALHEPGIVWGAWKASTVLRRRREEGKR